MVGQLEYHTPDKDELVDLLHQCQLLQTKLLILIEKYEPTQTERSEIPEPEWTSLYNGSTFGQVVHTT